MLEIPPHTSPYMFYSEIHGMLSYPVEIVELSVEQLAARQPLGMLWICPYMLHDACDSLDSSPHLTFICVNTMQAYPLCINTLDASLIWCPILEAEFGLQEKLPGS